jgi:excisionase family DNA binding protein
MAQPPKKFYTIEEAATLLGIPPAEVNGKRERNELHAYRDGAAWKFKVEEVDALVKELRAKPKPPAGETTDDDGGDVLLSEISLGSSESGTSGTVIGHKGSSPESDIRLAGSDIRLEGSGVDLSDDSRKAAAPRDELDMTLDEELSLDESQISKQQRPKAKPAAKKGPPAAAGEDDVLGGSGSGSDISIGSDSGISLVDPADSGLSLEEPLELSTGGAGGEESLELGEDDMLTFHENADTESPTELKTDDEFLLTPLEESTEEESESGSQVIALDTDTPLEAGGVKAAVGPAVSAMLDEDFGAQPGMAPGAPGAAVPGGFVDGAMMGAQAALPEAPYSPLVVVALVFCLLLLAVSGMMCFELVQNIHSWNGTSSASASIMDAILGLFEK